MKLKKYGKDTYLLLTDEGKYVCSVCLYMLSMFRQMEGLTWEQVEKDLLKKFNEKEITHDQGLQKVLQ